MIRIFHFLFCLLALSACTRKIHSTNAPSQIPISVKSTSKDTLLVEKPTSTTTPIPKIELPKLVASISKTACYGKCPVFEINVYSNKRAFFIGKSNAPRYGNYEAEIPAEMLEKIMQKAQEVQYFSLANRYPVSGNVVADLPSTKTFLKLNEVEKKIENIHHAPVQLLEFEQFMYDVLNKLSWKIAR